MKKKLSSSPKILFYDGICGFCQFVIRFVQIFDKKNKIKFCPLQKIQNEKLLSGELKTVCYFSNSIIYEKSDAILHVLTDLGFPFNFAVIFFLLPKFFRDLFYNFFSKIRYQLFGKKDFCKLSKNNLSILQKHKLSENEYSQASLAFKNLAKPIFLQANWVNLMMINYEIDSLILKKYVPPKTKLDEFHGKTYISLVAFNFLKTKVKGVYIPFHINFEEVNLRFYVKCNRYNKWERGVVFIKEIVPRFAIAFLAKILYGEKYVSMKMKHEIQLNDNKIMFTHVFGQDNKVECICPNEIFELQEGSLEEFIAEHYFGYATKRQKTIEYEVKHPRWKYYKVTDYHVQVKFNQRFPLT